MMFDFLLPTEDIEAMFFVYDVGEHPEWVGWCGGALSVIQQSTTLLPHPPPLLSNQISNQDTLNK